MWRERKVLKALCGPPDSMGGIAPGPSLSSSDSLSVCPLRLEKPTGESYFFLTAITSLAESGRLGEIPGRDPGREGSKVHPGKV